MTGIDPHTSLAMTYLRAYADHNRTVRGMKRATRKAEHQLRMHWSAVTTEPNASRTEPVLEALR